MMKTNINKALQPTPKNGAAELYRYVVWLQRKKCWQLCASRSAHSLGFEGAFVLAVFPLSLP